MNKFTSDFISLSIRNLGEDFECYKTYTNKKEENSEKALAGIWLF